MLEFNKLERKIAERLGNFAVTPCVGVWIEILCENPPAWRCPSLPVWECGLKYQRHLRPAVRFLVTPCVGVWIEMIDTIEIVCRVCVTPCVGVWIEIAICIVGCNTIIVTPCVGVWIEINPACANAPCVTGHSDRKSVV